MNSDSLEQISECDDYFGLIDVAYEKKQIPTSLSQHSLNDRNKQASFLNKNISESEDSSVFYSDNGEDRDYILEAELKPTDVEISSLPVADKWRFGIKKLGKIKDIWAEKKIIEKCRELKAKRFRYNVKTDSWVEDIVRIKMENKPFGRGALRECYRMKKISNTIKNGTWKNANNFVAKRFINPVPRKTYFEDVKRQMVSKSLSLEYNKMDPPKKIDMIQISIIEINNYKDSNNIFHIENFIEGEYIKYNSNSGFVENEYMRMTPQAFSHFTFQHTNGEQMVVDIQGVGDLYTDPVIHTSTDEFFQSDENLGIKGFALFFGTHVCNPVCKIIGNKKFTTLMPTEIDDSIISKEKINKQRPTIVESITSIDNYYDLSFDNNLNYLFYNSLVDIENQMLKYIYGKIYWQLAKYHSIGYFTNKTPNSFSCLFHLVMSANYGNIEGTLYLAKWLLSIPVSSSYFTDDYLDYSNIDSNEAYVINNIKKLAMKYLKMIYESCSEASYYLGCIYDEDDFSIIRDKTDVSLNIEKAMFYYKCYVENSIDNNIINGKYRYHILSRIAEICVKLNRINDASEYYSEAAESATKVNHAKMALNYFMKIDEISTNDD